MQGGVQIEQSAVRILLFEEVYPARAAQEQAEKSKLNAFGTLARLNPLNRPKAETVLLSKWELRYEPFWHVVARRDVDFTHNAHYALQITNPHARLVRIGAQDYPVLSPDKKPYVELAACESCHRRIDAAFHLDGMKREVKPATLQRYREKYKATEQEAFDREGALEPLLSSPAAIQMAMSRLASEAIDASEIQQDVVTIEKLYLYYRPVFAFEYAWSTSGKIGVIEVDGLTGEVAEAGEWFRDKLGRMMTRDTLVDLGADVASMVIPGGSIAVKVINKLA